MNPNDHVHGCACRDCAARQVAAESRGMRRQLGAVAAVVAARGVTPAETLPELGARMVEAALAADVLAAAEGLRRGALAADVLAAAERPVPPAWVARYPECLHYFLHELLLGEAG